MNLAVVGCGYWGPNLIRNCHTLPECTVKKVCDKDPNRLQYIQKLFRELEVTQDLSSIIEDPDIEAVMIATPVKTHFAIGKLSLMAGKHTFIEKPMATSSRDCRELIDIANKKFVVLMIGHTFVYNPTVRKIREIVASGDLGEILYASCRRLNLGLFQNDINVAWDLAPHDISILLYILDQAPVAINCQGKAHIRAGIEDVTSITLSFPNGGFALIQSSWIDPRKIREITIVGSKKMLVYDDTEPLEKIRIYDKCVEIPPHYDTFAEFSYSYHYGDIYSPYIQQVEPLRIECQTFLDSIRNGTEPDSGGEAGLKVVQILEAATQSLQQGGAQVRIDNKESDHRNTETVGSNNTVMHA